jgi:CTP synthase
VPGTHAAEAYGVEEVQERHRHRYEVNNAYLEALGRVGLIPSGLSPDGSLVEIGEIKDHPFMVGSQFHPELRSRPLRPHPLFRELVAAAVRYAAQQEAASSKTGSGVSEAVAGGGS